MQKLVERNTYTPGDASLVSGNCDLQLNREETLSVADSKTSSNNPEVNLLQHAGGLTAIVHVISVGGKPLMPCKPAKARKLLKKGRATVYKMRPFSIQLEFECENEVQEVKIGIDVGFKHIGFSAITDEKELISGTVELDSKTSSRLTEKRMYRRGRRNRRWYRKPRFLNRKKKKGCLPPSIQRKYDAHLKLIRLLQEILPASDKDIAIEVGSFDIQKIMNPEIEGTDYQQGDMYGQSNLRNYLMAREKGTCQLCNKPIKKGQRAEIHHRKERSQGGTNRAANLALLHEKCHEKLHKDGLKLNAPRQFKAETFMSIIQHKFAEDIPEAEITYGYITQANRNKLGLEKTHQTDAFVIAGGTTQQRTTPIEITQKHRNNRVLQLNRKGSKPSIRRERYAIQPKDWIWIAGKKYIVCGIQNKGDYVKVKNSKKVLPTRNIEKVYHFGSFAYE